MKTLLLLAVAAGGVFLLLRKDAEERARKTAERTAAEVAPQAVAVSPLRVTRKQCVIVRGAVVGSDAQGIMVDCEASAPTPQFQIQSYGGAAPGRGDTKRLAEMAGQQQRAEEARMFGVLQVVRSGRLEPAGWDPSDRARGVVRLAGYPAAAGAGGHVHVVAAPVSDRVYSASIDLAPDAPGDWMTMKRSNPLDQRARR